ncbi:ABC transporter substrate-binding protein [Oceanidesulfovibrio marinus]|uniref:ABC transporter substrate-binding protein n=1 Tax=Oceanidesulfovibrio marinus TaxID=370038 RepID=A0A6P1ZG98_9BACT|nr:ABC transporter substrate-binding protein [Oceanidesulfovibrio marinus]TVM33301.1 ABC transporter substrate-binding protein [Oceanidesulfovibrio marinus]
MRSHRSLLLVLVLLALCLCISACSEEPASETQSNQTEATAAPQAEETPAAKLPPAEGGTPTGEFVEAGKIPLGDDLLVRPWEEIVAAANGTTVRFYMYGGFAHTNKWVDGWVADQVKQRYGITLERVPMDASVFINKLLGEKSAGQEEGSIDLLWINGENFKNAREADLLFGPFAELCPNYVQHVDKTMAATDFGFPTDGYETPYGKAQFVFEYDTAKLTDPPSSFAELPTWVADNPGMFTYPRPPDFTGSAFIRQALYAVTGGYAQYMDGFEQELFQEKAPVLWDYLNGMEEQLWEKGDAYPKDSAILDTLFARGEVLLNMSYHPMHAQSKILDGTYPDTVRTFVMDEGSIYNLHFTAIPYNAPNKTGAVVVANFLMSPEAQLSKFDPQNWGDFPAIDLSTLSQEWRDKFAAVDVGAPTLSPEVLDKHAVPEIPAKYVEALENGWEDNVLHQ